MLNYDEYILLSLLLDFVRCLMDARFDIVLGFFSLDVGIGLDFVALDLGLASDRLGCVDCRIAHVFQSFKAFGCSIRVERVSRSTLTGKSALFLLLSDRLENKLSINVIECIIIIPCPLPWLSP